MEVVVPSKKRARTPKAPYAGKVYTTPGIPYQISQPNKFWRIKKGLSPGDYWRKRYYRRRITGKGAYVSNKSDNFGTRIGGWLGSRAGELIGGGAQALVKSLTGFGAYNVRRNALLDGQLPQVCNIPSGGGTVIRYQEFLADITTSTTAGGFKIQSYYINAANPQTFPFLSQIAANYEQFVVEGMLFTFRSTSSDALNSTNTALGTVMMATQYDALDSVFGSKLEMLNYEYSTSCKPSLDNVHMIECDPHQTTITELYTLHGTGLPVGADARLYYLGLFNIATQGFQATNVNIGELHVTYQVRLLKPKLFTSLGNDIGYATWSTSGVTNANPLGTTIVGITYPGNTPGVAFTATGITFPPSSGALVWSVVIQWIGTAVAFTAPTPTFVNCNVIAGTAQQAPQVGLAGTTVGIQTMSIVYTAASSIAVPGINFSGTGTLPGTASAFLTMRQVPAAAYTYG